MSFTLNSNTGIYRLSAFHTEKIPLMYIIRYLTQCFTMRISDGSGTAMQSSE